MTQTDQVRRHLEAGKTITPVTAMAVYGISRLSSVIEDLRQAGLKIDTLLKRDETGKQYGEYRLHRPIVVGSEVVVKPGYGMGLPYWVRKQRASEVIEQWETASLVLFKRGQNVGEYWLNNKELVNVG